MEYRIQIFSKTAFNYQFDATEILFFDVEEVIILKSILFYNFSLNYGFSFSLLHLLSWDL